MKILIAGAGKVGYHLAKTLSILHEITIIDKNPKAILKIKENLDVLAIHGDIENPNIFFQLEKNIDFFIAVTNSDEVNIISSLIIDDIISVNKKIIRLKNIFFSESSILKKLNIYDTVFPYSYTANTIKYLLEFPKANNVKLFDYGNMLLLSVKVNNIDFVGYNIREIMKKFHDKVMVVGVERDKEFFIPTPTHLVKEGDLLYLFGEKERIKGGYCDFEKQNNINKKIKNCIIFGADNLGIEIAKVLVKNRLNIKIIEKDLTKCQEAIDVLQDKVIVLNSRYGWGHLLKEEGLDNADMLIATTTNDEYNMIKSIEGKKAGIEKVIAINNDREYYSLMHSLDLIVVRGEKINSYYSILESINSDNIIKQKRYCGDKGVFFSKVISTNSKLIDKRITIPNKIKKISLIYVVRDKVIIKELNEHKYKSGDRVVLFSEIENIDIVDRWIHQDI
jgi:trk system potassium uptake protein TrkA